MAMEAKVVSLVKSSKYQDCLIDENRKYVIPEYQRPYSWGEKQLEEFFETIERALSGEQIFMGTVQFSKEVEGFHVIDGQQRLTTFLLFYRLLDLLDDEEEKYIKDYSKLMTICNFNSNQMALYDVLSCNYDEFNIVGKGKKEQKEFADSNESRYMKNMRILKTMLLELFLERNVKTDNDRKSFVKEIQAAIIDNIYLVELTTVAIPLPQVVSIFNTINTTGLDLDCSDLFKLQYFEYLKKVYGDKEKWMSRISECYELVNSYDCSMKDVLDVYKHSIVAVLDLGWEYLQKSNEVFYGEIFTNTKYANSEILSFGEFSRIVNLCCVLFKEYDNKKSKLFNEIEKKDKMLIFTEKLINETRYSRYWTLPYVFAVFKCDSGDKEDVVNNKFVEALEFGLDMAKYFVVFSVSYDKVINPVHTYVCGTVLPYIAGISNEKTKDIQDWKLEISKRTKWDPYLSLDNENGKDKGAVWVENRIKGNVFDNSKRARILCVLSGLVEEIKVADNSVEKAMELFFAWDKFKYDIDHIYPRNKFTKEYPEEVSLFNSLGNLVVLEAKKNRAIHDCEFFAESTDKKDDKKNKLVTYKESGFEIVKKVASVVELNIGKNNSAWDKKDVEARLEEEMLKITEFIFK